MATSEEQVEQDINQIYAPMKGKYFSGTFLGTVPMPLTESPRDKVCVTATNATIKSILDGIWHTIKEKYGVSVWKGFTGPNDNYSNNWLWVPCVSSDLNEGKLYDFQVSEIQAFTFRNPDPRETYKYGVDIRLKKQ